MKIKKKKRIFQILQCQATHIEDYSGCKGFWPSKVVFAVGSIYGNSTRDHLILSFFRTGLREKA